MSLLRPIRRSLRAGGLAMLMTVAGCASVVAPPLPAPATYDLGPADLRGGGDGRVSIDVVAPTWLDQPAMRYRLSYADPHEVRAYTRSRWVAPPGRLLGQRLVQAWVGPSLGTCRLVVAVDEWIHDFAAPERSRVVIAVDVRLVDRTGRRLGQRAFRREVAASRHDAPGMAAASREAVAGLLPGLNEWLAAGSHAGAADCQTR